MNRRTQGRVKQARKRAQKRADIRAGRILSMQEYLNRSAHQHQHEEEVYVADTLPIEPTDVTSTTATHQLVCKDSEGEEVISEGTQYAMRKLKAEQEALLLNGGVPLTYSVRKIKKETQVV